MIKRDRDLVTREELMGRLASIERQLDEAQAKQPSPSPDVWEKQHKAIAKLVGRRDALLIRLG
jgi:hypothetical protein